MTPSLLLSLVEGTELVAPEEDTLALRHDGVQITARRLTPGLLAALRRLAGPGATEAALAELATGPDGAALPRFYQVLHALDRRGLLRRAVQVEGRALASVCVMAPGSVFSSRRLLPGRSYQLSRFAYLRRQGAGAVVESPRSLARAVLHDGRLGALIAALAQPRAGAELERTVPGLPAAATCLVAELLLAAGLLEELTDRGTCPEDEEPQLQSWEFHDLLFHTRSRQGRHDGAFGGTYRFAGRLPAPPALKPPLSGQTIDLDRPDLERLAREDPPLELVVQQRRSLRDYGPEPLTVRQLGEFLFRVGRVKETHAVEVPLPGGPVAMEYTSRPYPGGGALYELELYVVASACGGLERGLYHYEPRGHRLERLPAPPAEWEGLLGDASRSTGIAADKLQVQLVVAARFQRLAWKYAGMAYALMLKHVGVLYQTMYLVATAMGLAPCGIGGGDSDRFARAAGTDYYAETSVGEFLLGSRP